MTVAVPRLTRERRLLADYRVVIACDEVGRGALAGPVAVGAVAITAEHARRRVPKGLRDSKLVPEGRRPDVAQRATAWVHSSAVGWASAAEIDAMGIMRALGLAAGRAIESLGDLADAVILLDGNYDYLAPVAVTSAPVITVIKGDRDCASVAAASVIAKVARDQHMVSLHDAHPAYGWDRNKGYASAAHRAALAEHGISRQHRASWALLPTAETLF